MNNFDALVALFLGGLSCADISVIADEVESRDIAMIKDWIELQVIAIAEDELIEWIDLIVKDEESPRLSFNTGSWNIAI